MTNLQLSKGLKIRPMRQTDTGFVETLYRDSRADLRIIDAENDYIETIIDQQVASKNVGYGEMFPDAMYFVVEKFGDQIGYTTVDFGNNEVHLIDILLIPEVRGIGYGEEIIKALQQAAAQTRAPLTLTVSQDNFGAKNFYLKLGFIVKEIESGYERMAWYPS